jgi:hypothetical protein
MLLATPTLTRLSGLNWDFFFAVGCGFVEEEAGRGLFLFGWIVGLKNG